MTARWRHRRGGVDKDIKQEGEEYFRKYGSYRNPYELGTIEHNDYERGYWQAYRREPEKGRDYY